MCALYRVWASLVVVAFAPTAFGDLILNIDTATQELFFTGSASGTPQSDIGFASINWTFGDRSSPAFDETSPFFLVNVTGGGGFLGGHVRAHASGGASVTILTNNATPVDLTGTGLRESYAGWSAANQTALEGVAGQTLTLSLGSGFGTLSAQNAGAAAAVPEPSSVAFLSLIGVGLVYRRWRKCTAQSNSETV